MIVISSVLSGLEWVVFDHALFEQSPFFSKLSLHTAILSGVSACVILAGHNSRLDLRLATFGMAYCLLLLVPDFQSALNTGTASPATIYCFLVILGAAFLSAWRSLRLPKTLYFLLFASVQAVGVMGVTQYILGVEAMGNSDWLTDLSAATSILLMLLSPLMFVQCSFQVLDHKKRYNLAYQNMAIALFVLPIFLSLLAFVPQWLAEMQYRPIAMPILLGLASLMSCWFLFFFGSYAGEKEAEVGQKLDEQALELETLYSEKVEAAEKVAEEQARFSSLLAHEIRTPLSTVLGMIEVLKIKKSKELESINCLDELRQIDSSAKLLREMINSVLDFAKLKSGRLSLSDRDCDLQELTNELGQVYSNTAKSKNISLEFAAIDEAIRAVRIDDTRVQEILSNLIDNALKFTNEGGRVSVSVTLENANLVFSVQDNGIGIAAEQQKHIFQPFRQASEGISRGYGGTGLGLSYSKELAEFMQGSLSAHSQVGQGSTFVLRVPYTQSTVPLADLAKVKTSESIPLNITDRNLKVLMVEDHPLNASIHSTLLNEIGVECVWVDSGEAALERLTNPQEFNVILMDINLGAGLDGLQTTKQLSEKFGREMPPVLALTAGTLEADIKRIADHGIQGIIPKPFDILVARESILNASTPEID